MPTVTGTLADFGLAPLDSFAPQIVFTPSSNAVVGPVPAYLLATKPIKVTPAPGGGFSATLTETDGLRPEVWYTIKIQWLDSSGGYTSLDFPDWKLYVPTSGGNVVDLMSAPWNPAVVWVGPTEPPGTPTVNTLWLNSTTGDLTRWAA